MVCGWCAAGVLIGLQHRGLRARLTKPCHLAVTEVDAVVLPTCTTTHAMLKFELAHGVSLLGQNDPPMTQSRNQPPAMSPARIKTVLLWVPLYGAMWSMAPGCVSEIFSTLGEAATIILAGALTGMLVSAALALGLARCNRWQVLGSVCAAA
jgi:hypothetical protein